MGAGRAIGGGVGAVGGAALGAYQTSQDNQQRQAQASDLIGSQHAYEASAARAAGTELLKRKQAAKKLIGVLRAANLGEDGTALITQASLDADTDAGIIEQNYAGQVVESRAQTNARLSVLGEDSIFQGAVEGAIQGTMLGVQMGSAISGLAATPVSATTPNITPLEMLRLNNRMLVIPPA